MDDFPTTSPVNKKSTRADQVMLSFPDAIKVIIEGKKITKLEWNNVRIYCVLIHGILKLHKTNNQYDNWIINDGDLLGEDWVILPE